MDQLEAALEASGIGELVRLWVRGEFPGRPVVRTPCVLGSISGQEIKILQAMVGRARDHTNPDSLIWG